MTLPGQIAHQAPPRANDTVRRVRNLERQVMMLGGQLATAQAAANAATAAANNAIEQMEQFTVGTNTFTVPKTYHAIATQNLTVPDGFTVCNFFAFASVNAQNTSAVDDFLTGQINGPGVGSGNQMSSGNVAGGAFGLVSLCQSGAATGLTAGDQVTFTLQVKSGQGWNAGAANQDVLTAFIVWKP